MPSVLSVFAFLRGSLFVILLFKKTNRAPKNPGAWEPTGSAQQISLSHIFDWSEVSDFFVEIFEGSIVAAAAFSGEN